jgi:outer membrane protein assembly factor BamB
MKDIRHISTSFSGQTIALAEFEKRVQIFDMNFLQIISEFDTILDFGGQRLAISEDGKICICGCWERHGICAYETKTGKLIWQRKDLKKVQHIHILYADNSKFFAQFEVGASRTFDINSGLEIDKVSGAKYLFNSKYLEIDIIDKSNKIQVIDRKTKKIKANIERQSFATLDLAIADNCLAISESGGPMSCYDIQSGEIKWRIPINEDGHFLRVTFNYELNSFIGVSWPFLKGGNKKLKYINKDNGLIEKEMTINCPTETEFALNGNVLVTSDREIIDLKSGEKKNWA